MLSHQSIVLKQCLDVENIAAAFASYLERLLHLRKLVYKSSESKEARLFNNELIVRYLVGNLRINLRPMWQPIMDVIRTHSVDENQKDFWTVFKELLAFAFDNNGEISDKNSKIIMLFKEISLSNSQHMLAIQLVTFCQEIIHDAERC